MANASTLNPAAVGLNIDIIGEPGCGKSHFARTAAAWATSKGRKAVGLVAPLAESLSYAGVDFEYDDTFVDGDWDPAGAGGKKSFRTSMDSVLERSITEWEKRDDIGVVIFDTFNAGPSEALWRRIVAEVGTDDFTALGGNARQPYVTYASRMTRLMDRLDLLRWRKHCHVIKLWHQDVREYEGAGVARKEQEKTVGGGFRTVVHWDLAKVPELRGQIMRQSILKWCDLGFYSEPVVGSNPFRCKFVVVPDGTRMAKSRLPVVRQLQAMTPDVPNDFSRIMQIVEGSVGK